MIDEKYINNTADKPLAIEPWDRVWGVGISGLTENPSPFPRINKMLDWLKNLDSTADSQRAMIVTECDRKYAMYPQNIKWAMTLRELYQRVSIHIWEDELIVGELVAPPNSAPIYPEFSIDWLVEEFRERPMDERKNDRYVVDQKVIDDVYSIQDYWKGKTVSEAALAAYTDEERVGSHLGAGIALESLFMYAGVGHVTANYERLLSQGFGGIRRQVEEKLAQIDYANPEDDLKAEFYKAELITIEGASTYIRR